jgi:hypothetical protein
MSKPNFILTRFTHGSAGKFLSSVLQTSDKIDHWSSVIQSNKNNLEIFKSLVLQYTDRTFPNDHSKYLKMEPMVPYNVDLYSSGYPRGNNVTLQQYLDNAQVKNDTRLLKSISDNLKINLIFHKPCPPVFCDSSCAVTITVTTESEKDWLYKTLWSKHFLEKDNRIHYLPSDPDHCSFYSLIPVLTYNNQYLFPAEQKQQLYEHYVINDHTNQWYFDPDWFKEYDTDHKINNVFIKLEEILNIDKFLLAMSRIFDHHNLGVPDLSLIEKMHRIWLSKQISYDL